MNKTKVDISKYMNLSVYEQADILVKNGYMPGITYYSIILDDEWKQIVKEDIYHCFILYSPRDLMNCEKKSTSFILRDDFGSIIDELNFITVTDKSVNPEQEIAQAWIGRTNTGSERVILMNTNADEFCYEWFGGNEENFTCLLTKHDLHCFEAEMRFFYSTKMFYVIPVANGRFALSVNFKDANTTNWTCFPTCGDGNMGEYSLFLSLFGTSIRVYDTLFHSSMTFRTEEEAFDWAYRVGIHVTRIVDSIT